MSVAVDSRPAVNGHDNPELKAETTSPSRFTAVNGCGEAPSGSLHNHRSSESPTTAAAAAAAAAAAQNHAPSQSVETGKDVLPNAPPDSSDKGGGVASPQENGDDRTKSDHSPNRHKRKRTISPHGSSSPAPNASRSPPSRPPDGNVNVVWQQVAEVNGSPRPASALESDVRANPVPSGNATVLERPDVIPSNFNAPSREDSYDSQPHGAQLLKNEDSSDARLAEALQQQDAHQAGGSSSSIALSWEPASATTNGSVAVEPSSPPAQNSSEQPQRLSGEDRPKKKRAFGHRTKTGCMTCRQRKKKCDEQHPQCNNCIRGGFSCAGYGVRASCPRQPHSNGPVPLEPRNRYQEITAAHYLQDITPQRPNISGPSAVHTNGTRSKLLSVNDADRNMPTPITSPSGGGSRHAWRTDVWPSSSSSSFVPNRPPPKAGPREGVMMNGTSQAERPRSDPHIIQQPVRDLSSHPSHGRPGMAVFPSSMDQRPAPPTRLEAASYSAQAAQALNSMPSGRGRRAGRTEKENMRAGENYDPEDPELVEERRRCKVALARFESAQNPLQDVSEQEKTRLLNEVLRPRPISTLENQSIQNLTSLGSGIVIETPFRCHYGYNIDIGQDVMISEGCTLIDDCGISVGERTWIGPGVQIISSMAVKDIDMRKGRNSRYQGRPVKIGDHCWIGPGCTILPGVTIRQGARISPGEVVMHDVGQYDTHGQPVNC